MCVVLLYRERLVPISGNAGGYTGDNTKKEIMRERKRETEIERERDREIVNIIECLRLDEASVDTHHTHVCTCTCVHCIYMYAVRNKICRWCESALCA